MGWGADMIMITVILLALIIVPLAWVLICSVIIAGALSE